MTGRRVMILLAFCLLWILAVFLFSGCATARPFVSHEESILSMHRHYEKLMGLEEFNVYFLQPLPEHPEWCGWITRDLILGPTLAQGPAYVVYAPCANRETVIHETCHLRWQHQDFLDRPLSELHREIEDCPAAYKAREKRAAR